MKKLYLLLPLFLVGCVTTMPEQDNIKRSSDGNFIEGITFQWKNNKNIDRTVACIKKEMPALIEFQSQDVIRFIDKKNNEIVGDGSMQVNKYDPFLKTTKVKFKYDIEVGSDTTTLTFKDIYTSYPTNQFTKLQPYSELLADDIYNELQSASDKIKFCK